MVHPCASHCNVLVYSISSRFLKCFPLSLVRFSKNHPVNFSPKLHRLLFCRNCHTLLNRKFITNNSYTINNFNFTKGEFSTQSSSNTNKTTDPNKQLNDQNKESDDGNKNFKNEVKEEVKNEVKEDRKDEKIKGEKVFNLSDFKKSYEKDKNDEEFKEEPKSRFWRFFDPSTMFAVGLGAIMVLELIDTGVLKNEITFQEFLSKYFIKGYVDRIQVVNKDFCRCYLSDLSPIKTPKFVSFRLGSIDAFEQKIDDIQGSMGLHPQNYIPIHYVNEVNFLAEVKKITPFVLVTLLLAMGVRKISVKSSSGMDRFLKMGKASPLEGRDVKVNVKFEDVAGMREAKCEITEFVDFLRSPKTYESYGAKIPKGVLLCGAPGTGKTLLAKAVAGEANVPFYSMSGSDFIEVFVGVGPSRVRDLFEKARKNAPSIVFIDEIDAIGRKRSKSGFNAGSNDERENTLNQLLVEMDGFKSSSGVIVLAGTNRADILDPALTRPGRFDRTVNISRPDLEERYEIFKVHLKPIKINTSSPVGSDKTAENVDKNAEKNKVMDEFARKLAALTPNFVGAEIANVCNEAAIQAARRKSANGVEMVDFDNAIERVMAGMKKSGDILTPQQKLAVAYHEVGHALVGWFLENADPVLKVSIIPRSSGALGFNQQMPDDSMLFTRDALLDKIAVILGGRAAEDIFIGKITTGATDDLSKVTKMCYAFVSQWGMNKEIGLVSFQRDNTDDPYFYRNYSENTAQLIDQQVRTIIEDQYLRVKKMLLGKAELVHKLSKLLYDKETITYQDIVQCVGEREFPIKDKYKPYIEVNCNDNVKND
ncbi:mitochondrial respiratory chain complexes assembly protein (AFG3 homologue), putative [Theileria annulata]|uniref:Mitochondrial respiratory chain complexes assembly protein (AFG3 homologue), putative n=1 Tax=Theileria annulata TaxID=5874 RepID=Q4UED3_THEAN|nr:mitochondrial respiratory chain complexes assembly protein (AFG3 homologue), putative [Theileria annulata]CAI74556.1 mitochondrial respiratory chain complexes assembly protein (AFG3 homologue), putative [Theileria annulata]|eukprot:XP_952288.1 mitochondrial respiratory chain complexes assembly protein (AFG3 homologue), putative [Theileria annulata]